MKNLLISSLFVIAVLRASSQIPAAGNLLWLRADRGVFSNNSGTHAILGDLVEVWEDQSGQGNHFSQPFSNFRPQWVAIPNTLCSQPLMRFDVSRRTYLASAFKLSGAKSIFIVFLQPGLSGNPQTLFSLKGNANTYTEILCSDHPAYQPLSYMAEMPGSVSGGTTMNSVGNNISFSPSGNIFTMTYNGAAASAVSSYSSSYNASSVAVQASGLFGRLMHDTTTIGGRAPEQNYSFLTGYIGEIIVYNRVLSAPEINQVEAYLQGKYGFLGSCNVLPVHANRLRASLLQHVVKLTWEVPGETGIRDYVAEHSTDQVHWDNLGNRVSGTGTCYWQDAHPKPGMNYYRVRINYIDGRIRYSEVESVNYSDLAAEAPFIYPNPVTDRLFIRTGTNRAIHLTIFTADGRVLKELEASGNTSIDMQGFRPGMYFIRVNGIVQKFLKQ